MQSSGKLKNSYLLTPNSYLSKGWVRAVYLHLGQDYIVPLQSVVTVFDMDTATASRRTRLLLERLQDEGRIIELYDDLPRAAVLCENALGETLYLTQLSPQAIQRRAEKEYAV